MRFGPKVVSIRNCIIRRKCRLRDNTPARRRRSVGLPAEELLNAIVSVVSNASTTRANVFKRLDHMCQQLPGAADRAYVETLCKMVQADVGNCNTSSLRRRMRQQRSEFMQAYMLHLQESAQSLLDKHGVPFTFRSIDEVLLIFSTDHIFPKVHGGPDSVINYVVLPKDLNSFLSDSLPDEGDKAHLMPWCVRPHSSLHSLSSLPSIGSLGEELTPHHAGRRDCVCAWCGHFADAGIPLLFGVSVRIPCAFRLQPQLPELRRLLGV